MADLIALYVSEPGTYQQELESETKKIMNSYSQGLCWTINVQALFINPECIPKVKPKSKISIPSFTDADIPVIFSLEVIRQP
jgi:hypothetical protein